MPIHIAPQQFRTGWRAIRSRVLSERVSSVILSALLATRETGGAAMKELVLPVPETVSASYTVPVPAPVSAAEARRLAGEAVGARLTGPLRTLTAAWLTEGAVKVGLAGPLPPGLLERLPFGSPDQRVSLAQARAFVQFSVTQRASLIAMQEWKARAPAAA